MRSIGDTFRLGLILEEEEMKITQEWLDKLATFQLMLAAFAVLGILLAIFIDVCSRAIFNAPIGMTLDIVSYWCMIPVTFFPLMYLEIRREHIETDLFYSRFSPRLRHLSDLISGILATAIYVGIAWLTFQQAITATQSQEVSMGVNLIPIWPARWILPLAFGSAAFASILVTVRIFSREEKHV